MPKPLLPPRLFGRQRKSHSPCKQQGFENPPHPNRSPCSSQHSPAGRPAKTKTAAFSAKAAWAACHPDKSASCCEKRWAPCPRAQLSVNGAGQCRLASTRRATRHLREPLGLMDRTRCCGTCQNLDPAKLAHVPSHGMLKQMMFSLLQLPCTRESSTTAKAPGRGLGPSCGVRAISGFPDWRWTASPPKRDPLRMVGRASSQIGNSPQPTTHTHAHTHTHTLSLSLSHTDTHTHTDTLAGIPVGM